MLDHLIGAVRAGEGRALLVLGEPGGGKSAQVLGFVARRLAAESVGLVFAARVPAGRWRGTRAGGGGPAGG